MLVTRSTRKADPGKCHRPCQRMARPPCPPLYIPVDGRAFGGTTKVVKQWAVIAVVICIVLAYKLGQDRGSSPTGTSTHIQDAEIQRGKCTACNGRGRVPFACMHCKGSGFSLCGSCSGTGQRPFVGPCISCRGTGRSQMMCSFCSGKGFPPCAACDGTGRS